MMKRMVCISNGHIEFVIFTMRRSRMAGVWRNSRLHFMSQNTRIGLGGRPVEMQMFVMKYFIYQQPSTGQFTKVLKYTSEDALLLVRRQQ